MKLLWEQDLGVLGRDSNAQKARITEGGWVKKTMATTTSQKALLDEALLTYLVDNQPIVKRFNAKEDPGNDSRHRNQRLRQEEHHDDDDKDNAAAIVLDDDHGGMLIASYS
jgi:hypothetical protein